MGDEKVEREISKDHAEETLTLWGGGGLNLRESDLRKTAMVSILTIKAFSRVN